MAAAVVMAFVLAAGASTLVWRRLRTHLRYQGESRYAPLFRPWWDQLEAEEIGPDGIPLWRTFRVLKVLTLALWIPASLVVLNWLLG